MNTVGESWAIDEYLQIHICDRDISEELEMLQ